MEKGLKLPRGVKGVCWPDQVCQQTSARTKAQAMVGGQDGSAVSRTAGFRRWFWAGSWGTRSCWATASPAPAPAQAMTARCVCGAWTTRRVFRRSRPTARSMRRPSTRLPATPARPSSPARVPTPWPRSSYDAHLAPQPWPPRWLGGGAGQWH